MLLDSCGHLLHTNGEDDRSLGGENRDHNTHPANTHGKSSVSTAIPDGADVLHSNDSHRNEEEEAHDYRSFQTNLRHKTQDDEDHASGVHDGEGWEWSDERHANDATNNGQNQTTTLLPAEVGYGLRLGGGSMCRHRDDGVPSAQQSTVPHGLSLRSYANEEENALVTRADSQVKSAGIDNTEKAVHAYSGGSWDVGACDLPCDWEKLH